MVAVSQLIAATAADGALTTAAVARGEELEGLQVRRPSLEEVYLALTAEAEEVEA